MDGGGAAVVPCTWFTGPEEDCCHWPPGRVKITESVKDQLIPSTDWPQFRVRVLGKHVLYQCFLSDNSDDIYVPTNYTFLKTSNILCMCFATNYARQKLSKAEVNSDLQSESDLGKGRGKRRRW